MKKSSIKKALLLFLEEEAKSWLIFDEIHSLSKGLNKNQFCEITFDLKKEIINVHISDGPFSEGIKHIFSDEFFVKYSTTMIRGSRKGLLFTLKYDCGTGYVENPRDTKESTLEEIYKLN